uniref:hypothetical protein n=1 Tax=Rhodospora sordida TaxID=362230 RepID=UPI001FCCDCCB|nr:hypothetical protein MW557_pgp069 [Rhodospora sordida]UNJ15025.1 hypothetical protein [Rhodospora sordida]
MLTPYQKCPVPRNQQPRNEYNALKQSYLFAFSILPLQSYCLKLFNILMLTAFLSSPFIATGVDLLKDPLYFFIISTSFSTIVLVLILLRTYLGWSYISKRLLSATIVYEESGWYDIEIWIKPPIELAQDRLIAEYTIKPILKRIQYSNQFFIAYFFLVQFKNAIR